MSRDQRLAAHVVGGVDSGEADRIVHILTDEGRLAVFAPNAKRSRRRFAGALEPFSTIDIQLTTGRTRGGLPTLSDAVVRVARLPLRRQLDTIALASYFAELGFRTAPEGQPSDVAPLVAAGWDRLQTESGSLRLRRAFELRLMALLGYHPELARCLHCGASTEPGYLDLIRGGLLCAVHRGAAPVVGPKTVHWLQAVLAAPALDPLGGVDVEWAETAATKVTGPFSAFWSGLFDRPLKASGLLADVGL